MSHSSETLTQSPIEWKAQPTKRDFKRDFDALLYLWEKTDITFEDVVNQVGRYLVEKLMKPSYQEMRVGYDGELDPEFERRMLNAIEYWTERGDDRAVYQFSMELEGMRNMAMLVAKSKAQNGSFPSVVVASHPGDFYDRGKDVSKVVTNIGVEGWEVDNGYRYRYCTTPSRNMSLATYYSYIEEVAQVNETESLLQMSMGELTAASLVAFPHLVDASVEARAKLAERLGYPSWQAVEKLAQEQMEDSDDSTALVRRQTIVQEFAQHFWDAKQIGDSDALTDLSDAMAQIIAMDYAHKYRGKGPEFIREEIDRMTRLARAERLQIFKRTTYSDTTIAYAGGYDNGFDSSFADHYGLGDLTELYAYRVQMMIAQTDPRVQEGLVTGCGGGGIAFSQGSGMDMFSIEFQLQNSSLDPQMNKLNSEIEVKSGVNDIVVRMSDGTTYVLTIREGWRCRGDGCERVSSQKSKVRIGECHICEYCDPNVHKAD